MANPYVQPATASSSAAQTVLDFVITVNGN
jgi:hypothetical protein